MKDPQFFIGHMLDSIAKIESFSSGLTERAFVDDTLRQSAVIREIEVIGEASKNIPDEFAKKHPEIDWKKIAGMRDKLIHHYFDITLLRVWNTVKDDLPKLKQALLEIQKEKE